MLEQKDPLPGPECQPPIGDRDRQLGLGQHAFDVRRHVVRTFVIVTVKRHILGDDPPQKRFEVMPDVRRGVLLDQQRGRERAARVSAAVVCEMYTDNNPVPMPC